MRAVLLTDYGDVDKLELRDGVPEPVAAAEEIKVRLAGSSVNPIDWKLRSGAYRQRTPLKLPAILGRDASGEVVAVGSEVSAFRVGARVCGLVDRAYAEYVVARGDAWAEVPAAMDAADAAALPLVVLTGSQLIDEALRPRPGQAVLITGAVGSVGRAAVFTARSRGAEVLAGVRRAQKEEAASLNVDVVAIDDDAEIDRLPRLDGIADTVGGQTLQKLLAKVRTGGAVASVLGEAAGAKERGLNARGHLTHPDARGLAALIQAVDAGKLLIPIAKRMPLERIREAQTLAENGAGGKIVLRVH